MKSARILFICLLSVLAFLAPAAVSSAQYLNPDETGEQLFARADREIFVRAPLLTQDFSEHQGYTNEIVQTGTMNLIHEYFVYGGYATDMLIAIDPVEEPYRNPTARLSFNSVWKPAFHVKLDFQKGDEQPANGGRCWIRYSDIVIAGKGNEKGVIVYPGDKAYYFETTRGETAYTEIADLSSVSLKRDSSFNRDPIPYSEAEDQNSLSQFKGMDVYRRDVIQPSGSNPRNYNHLDVIRLDGVAFFYLDGQFLFSYADGIKNALSFDAGAEIDEGGIYVECNFDNFVMSAP